MDNNFVAIDDYYSKLIKNADLDNDKEELHDILNNKDRIDLEKLNRVVQHYSNDKYTSTELLHTLIFKMYTNCIAVYKDFKANKKINYIFSEYERKIYIGLTIICICFILMLFNIN